MMSPHRDPYRWQDHAISPDRAVASLVSSALILVAIGGAVLLTGASPIASDPLLAARAASERTPPLAEMARRPTPLQHAREWLRGC
jgi:hypothetical protein